jgi:hypothetical protein
MRMDRKDNHEKTVKKIINMNARIVGYPSENRSGKVFA